MPIVTAPGGAPTDTELLVLETALNPYPLTVVTVNVYAVPFDNPVTTMGEPEPLPVMPLGEDVAV